MFPPVTFNPAPIVVVPLATVRPPARLVGPLLTDRPPFVIVCPPFTVTVERAIVEGMVAPAGG